MKNKLFLLMMVFVSFTISSQKKELKAAEKLFKAKDYKATLEKLKSVEPLLNDAADKYKEKYYYLKAKSTYGNGKKQKNNAVAGVAFQKLIDFEKETNQKKYKKDAENTLQIIVQNFATSGSKSYKSEKYKQASYQFEMVYTLSKADTSYLDNAALSAFLDKNYDKSVKLYQKLLDLGYTGITTQYRAKSNLNDDYVYFANQKDMDNQVLLKAASQPEVYQTESRTGDIAKNIALSYIAKGEEQAALDAIAEAKKAFPKDYTLVISEANIYYKLGNNKKFLEGLKEAISIKPDDPSLYYNVGVLTLEQGYIEEAIASFEKAVELKPDYADAYNNIGVAILEKTKPIIKEMNKNLSNFKKYDQLNLKQKVVYREALPYFEKTLELKPNDKGILSTLVGLYELLEMYKKQKATKARMDAL